MTNTTTPARPLLTSELIETDLELNNRILRDLYNVNQHNTTTTEVTREVPGNIRVIAQQLESTPSPLPLTSYTKDPMDIIYDWDTIRIFFIATIKLPDISPPDGTDYITHIYKM